MAHDFHVYYLNYKSTEPSNESRTPRRKELHGRKYVDITVGQHYQWPK
jgi:hypothetical protein